MKMLLAAAVCAVALTAQIDSTVERKHLSVPLVSSLQPLGVTANEIDRGLPYPSVIHLKGAVEIRMPVCVVIGPGTTHRCGGEIVFHADEATLDEKTGQVEAKGAINVTRK